MNSVIAPDSGSERKNNMNIVRDRQRLALSNKYEQAVFEAANSIAGNSEELTDKSASGRISPSQHGRLSTQSQENAYFTRDRYLSYRSETVSKKALTMSGSGSIRTDGGKFINTTDLIILSDQQVMEICRLSGPHLEFLNFHLLRLASFIRYHYEDSTALGDISKAEACAL